MTFAYVVYALCGCRVDMREGDGPDTAVWLLSWMAKCKYIQRGLPSGHALDICICEVKDVTQLKLL